MIRDVMVWLDGGVSDEIRLAAVADIARRLQPHVIIGLFLNPSRGPVEGDATAELIEHAREAGDEIEKVLTRRLQMLSGRSRSGGSMCWPTTSPRLLRARRAPPTPLSRGVPMVRWIPINWSKGFCSDRAETVPGSRDRAAKHRFKSYPDRLERQPGISPGLGRSPTVSTPGG
jgi:hypothetical protein